MAWSRFEPGFSRHPKRIRSGPLASWLWICGIDHCTEFRTDGFIDEAAVAALCPAITGATLKRCVQALVESRSWLKVEGGYQVHGYLEHNPSAEQVEADRAAARARYRKWKDRRSSNAVADDETTEQHQRRANSSVPYRSVGRSVGRSKPPNPPLQGGSPPEPGSEEPRAYRLHAGMFNDCRDGKAGMCVRSEYLDQVPTPVQCPEHRTPASEA